MSSVESAADDLTVTAPGEDADAPPVHRRRSPLQWAIVVVIGAVVLVALPSFMPSDYYRGLLVLSLIYAIYGIGYDVQFGYAGLFNLGHAMFFGIGAYTVALMSSELEIHNVLFTLPAAIVMGVIAAFLLGLISLKREGHQLAMISLGLSQVALLVVLNEDGLTNGPVGVSVSPGVFDLGFVQFDLLGTEGLYFLALSVLIISVFFVQRVLQSRLGSSWLCVRENMVLARSQGIKPFRSRMAALLIGAGLGSAAGGLFAYNVGFLTPEVFSLSFIVTALVVVIVGGSGTTYGAIFGAFIFTLLPEYLRSAADLRLLIFGAVLALVMLFMPDGLWPLLTKGLKRALRLRRAQA